MHHNTLIKTDTNYYLQLAGGCNIEIVFKFYEAVYIKKKFISEFNQQYQGFLLQGKPQKILYRIIICDNPITYEIKKSTDCIWYFLFYIRKRNTITTSYQISLVLFETIIRILLFEYLFSHSAVLIHSSASLVKNKLYIFLGNSGAGKSTIVKLINRDYPTVADDILILRKEKNILYAYQVPFLWKEHKYERSKRRYIVGKFFSLFKTKNIVIRKETSKELILERMMQQVFIEREKKRDVLLYLNKIVQINDIFYNLNFSKNKSELLRKIGSFNE